MRRTPLPSRHCAVIPISESPPTRKRLSGPDGRRCRLAFDEESNGGGYLRQTESASSGYLLTIVHSQITTPENKPSFPLSSCCERVSQLGSEVTSSWVGVLRFSIGRGCMRAISSDKNLSIESRCRSTLHLSAQTAKRLTSVAPHSGLRARNPRQSTSSPWPRHVLRYPRKFLALVFDHLS